MDKLSLIFLIVALESICSKSTLISSNFGNQTNVTPNLTQFRQDEEAEGNQEVLEGLQAVAGPVSQIIAGSLTGNFSQLFSGVSGTISDDEDTQTGINQILGSVATPLNKALSVGIAGAQNYLNITTMNPNKIEKEESTQLPFQPAQQLLHPGDAIAASQQLLQQQLVLAQQQQALLQQLQQLPPANYFGVQQLQQPFPAGQQQLQQPFPAVQPQGNIFGVQQPPSPAQQQASLFGLQQSQGPYPAVQQPPGNYFGLQQPQGPFGGVPQRIFNPYPPTRSPSADEDEDEDEGENDSNGTRQLT